jgi:hypothetical protein
MTMEYSVFPRMKMRLILALLLAAALALGLACSSPASSTRGEAEFTSSSGGRLGAGSIADRQLLGLFSHNWSRDFKTKAPASEWKHVRNARIMIGWGPVEYRKGQYKWSYSDAMIEGALSLGIDSLLVTIGQPIPKWARNPDTPIDPSKGPPQNYDDFRKFCKKFAERYKDVVDAYQIWNEPGWDLDAPPAEKGVVYFYGLCDFHYMGLLRAGHNGIKSADPDAYVISGAMMNGITREPDNFVNYDLLMAGANQDISMKVEADRNIVAERPMYFNYHGVWPGGHDQVGIASPEKKWFLAEGATHPGFEEWICIQNPGNTDTGVNITYMFPGGETRNQAVGVKAHSRLTVDVNSAVGPDRNVSARLEADQPIVVERPMYFNYHGWCTGGSIEAATNELSDTWYLAEGTTNPGFEQWISIMNPNPHPVDIDITYMFEGGATQKQKFTMLQTSRDQVMVNEIVGPNKDVSATVVGTGDIIVERPMYFNYHEKWTGGHDQIGAMEPATSWFLSEGTTRNNPDDGSFEEWISIQNPGDDPAKVDITYMFNEGGTQPGSIDVPAHARETILVNEEVGDNRDVSVKLDSDVPVVVERPMYFNYRNKWAGGTNELGCTGNQKTWYFAEGTTRTGFEEWLTLQNPNAAQATATVTCMFSDGTTQKKQVTLPPNSRTTVDMNRSVSMATICDSVAVHPYDYPEYWAWYYGSVVNICNQYGGKEVVVTEIGWPHGGRDEFSMEGQRKAFAQEGIGSLWNAGCTKIWAYEDVDDAPGTSWDDAENGLFTYYGQATPAWSEYKNWQSQLPDYPNLPTSLPW